jgi:hypothetical protein
VTKNTLEVNVKIDNFLTELGEELVLSINELVPDYFLISRLNDLYENPYVDDFVSMRTTLHRKIKLWSAMYYLKSQLITKTNLKDTY